MKPLILLLACTSALWAVNYGNGPTPSCYSNSSYTTATSCQAQEGQTIYIVFSATSTATAYGHMAGTFTQTDPTHGKYVAPLSIIPAHSVIGVQQGISNSAFYTRIDNLPVWSGNAAAHVPVWPVGSPTPGSTNSNFINGQPGYISMTSLNFSPADTEFPTILDGTEPNSWYLKGLYGNPAPVDTFPDPRNTSKLKREGGSLGNPILSGGPDYHSWMIDPTTDMNYEVYQDLIFGWTTACSAGNNGATDCIASSFRRTPWNDPTVYGGINAAGTLLGPLEIGLDEVLRGSINHAAPLTMAGAFIGGSKWPAVSAHTGNIGSPPYGSRFRLKASFSMTGVHKVSISSAGTGYNPGSLINGTVASCPGAAVVAAIGTTGGIANSGGYFAWVSQTGGTGTTCPSGNLAITWDTPPGGGTAPVGNAYQSTISDPNNSQVFVNQAQRYGWVLTDIGGSGQVEIDPDIHANGTVNNAMYQFLAAAGSPFLYEIVDDTGADSGGRGTANDLRVPWDPGTGAGPGASGTYWQANSANSLEGSTVIDDAVVKIVSTANSSQISYLNIPLQGVAVGSQSATMANRINVIAGGTPYIAPHWVTGTPNTAVTWSMYSDPCPGLDSINATTGAYTPCSSVSTVSYGTLKITSNADPNAVAFVSLTVIPGFVNGKLGIDTDGAGGTLSNGDVWQPDCCYEYIGNPAADGPWYYAQTPNANAPNSFAGELPIYRNQRYGYSDIVYGLEIPNGHYYVRVLTGEVYNGASALTRVNPQNHSFNAYGTQGSVKLYGTCYSCKNNFTFANPVDWYVPATVTQGQLVFTAYGYTPIRDNSGNIFIGGNTPDIAGIQIIQDTTTPPHWELGSVPYHQTAQGDQFKISPGSQLQMYARNVFTTAVDNNDKPDATWSVLNGPGSIDPVTGLFTPPTSLGYENVCSTVQAQSQSQPSIKATASVCTTGSHQISIR